MRHIRHTKLYKATFFIAWFSVPLFAMPSLANNQTTVQSKNPCEEWQASSFEYTIFDVVRDFFVGTEKNKQQKTESCVSFVDCSNSDPTEIYINHNSPNNKPFNKKITIKPNPLSL